MSETLAGLRRKIKSAEDLRSVVRTMKTLASSNTRQYERSVNSLAIYYHTVELGLSACFRQGKPETEAIKSSRKARQTVGVVVFGSDQGLVGRFNEAIAEYTVSRMAAIQGNIIVWAVGERVFERLSQGGLTPTGLFVVPNSVKGITPFVGQILVEADAGHMLGDESEWYLFYNRPSSGAIFVPIEQKLLPLDSRWRNALAQHPWPTKNLPEPIGERNTTLQSLIREFVFVSLFRACAESLASENASRLAAMQRADKSIEEILESLKRTFHELRQNDIDAELFDVISGFEAARSIAKPD